jgi:hypothetical protein
MGTDMQQFRDRLETEAKNFFATMNKKELIAALHRDGSQLLLKSRLHAMSITERSPHHVALCPV